MIVRPISRQTLLGIRRLTGLLAATLGCLLAPSAVARVGAEIPWTTIEAEDMRTTGTVLGPAYGPHQLETESSRQQCVRLDRAGEGVEFTSPAAFDSLVVRFNLPDAPGGGGTSSVLELLVNGERVREFALSSRNSWLYGNYPFSNDPAQGKPRNFYDEIRLKGIAIADGDVVSLRKTTDDGVACVVDLVDLERMPAPVARPEGSLSIADFGAKGDGADATEALRAAIAKIGKRGGTVWAPAGDYLITGDIIVSSGVTVQGAGMWHTNFVGSAELYGDAARRVRFKLTGENSHVADFAITGALNYRNDQEANDGVVVASSTDGSVKRIWVEHTKAGVWVYNGTRLTVEGCRFRNMLADGVNFCVGTNHSVVDNCTARGTGDDCYAIWPAPADQGHDEFTSRPGFNVIRRSTGQLTFLANGGAIYGGASNRIEDCLFTDITTGCGILISTTFPTADAALGVDNNFSGETGVENSELVRCGGYDHSWAWRSSLQICMDRRSITGLTVKDVEIRESLSEGITVVAPGHANGKGILSETRLENVRVSGVSIGDPGRAGVWIRADAAGGFTLVGSDVGEIRNESADFKIDPVRASSAP